MSLRVGIDLDGTLADLSSGYHSLERRLFGNASTDVPDDADGVVQESADRDAQVAEARQRRVQQDAVWKALKDTPDFWMTLAPIEPGVVRRIYEVGTERRWEVFFITQRPATVGMSVQRQTQLWLMQHGFETPSVLTLSGSRGRAASVLDLDFLIDDLPKNCVDVVSDSRCRPILVSRDADETLVAPARRMKVPIVSSVHDALDVMSSHPTDHRETVVHRILRSLGLA